MPMSYWKKQTKAGRPPLGAMKELMQNTEWMKHCYNKEILSQFSNDENPVWKLKKKKSASSKQKCDSANKGDVSIRQNI